MLIIKAPPVSKALDTMAVSPTGTLNSDDTSGSRQSASGSSPQTEAGSELPKAGKRGRPDDASSASMPVSVCTVGGATTTK